MLYQLHQESEESLLPLLLWESRGSSALWLSQESQ